MSEVAQIIESGILELYAMGQTNASETIEVERLASLHPAVRAEIEEITLALERYALEHAVEPPLTILPFLMASIDYMERMKNGEVASFPPILNAGSRVSDFAEWLNRADLQPHSPLEEVHATIIGFTPQVSTAIVWLKRGAPPEVHTSELERFLIVEGTCDITVGADVHSFKPGDFFDIPLHISHHVRVTSDIPCKLILQRIAA